MQRLVSSFGSPTPALLSKTRSQSRPKPKHSVSRHSRTLSDVGERHKSESTVVRTVAARLIPSFETVSRVFWPIQLVETNSTFVSLWLFRTRKDTFESETRTMERDVRTRETTTREDSPSLFDPFESGPIQLPISAEVSSHSFHAFVRAFGF